MFSHVMVGSNDIERSKTFYDALFTAIGGKPGRIDPKGRLFYLHKGAAFMVSKPIDGGPACHANGGTIAPDEVEAWHKARDGTWRHRHRGPARSPPGQLRTALPRLSARPGRQQALRALQGSGVTSGHRLPSTDSTVFSFLDRPAKCRKNRVSLLSVGY
jgi:hypothetical protein